ncbi:TlpA family protein disulfide reductase [Chondrinema litorale]|uniref:TlpA family protein disulfide reductase n=1 Tax=Chondrinema litorale TaxID=2994555 RepID=UPI002543A251|nr:TlpA disulfide reductase family protein [Chondrinema litorale]UZR97049.1 TlpA disulfide reductase family protein [Chondrinema litorale]
MKKDIAIFLLVCFSTLLFANFQLSITESPEKKRFKLRVHTPDASDEEVSIYSANSIDYSDSIIHKTTYDSLGNAVLELDLHKPALVYLDVDKGSGHPIYIEPNYDMEVLVYREQSRWKYFYTGKGSAVNNYLEEIRFLQDVLEGSVENYIMSLDPPDFVERVEEMRTEFSNFHQAYIDSVKLSAEQKATLEKKNQLMLISLKERYIDFYETGSSSDKDKTKWGKLNDSFYDFPLVASYFDNELLRDDYIDQIDDYADQYVLKPLYDSLPKISATQINDTLAVGEVLPFLIADAIKQRDYPEKIKELMLAQNTLEVLDNGISHISDSLLNNFEKLYPKSEFLYYIHKQIKKVQPLTVGNIAPNITGITFGGEHFSLDQLKGKVVYVDVWATWCGPCKTEMPFAEKLQDEFKGNDEVVFLNVSVDAKKEKWDEMLKEKPIGGVNIIIPTDDLSAFLKTYSVSGIPRYILIDQEGKLIDANALRPSTGKVKAEIEKLL